MLIDKDLDTMSAFCRKCDAIVPIWARAKGVLVCGSRQRQVQHEHMLSRYGISYAEYERMYEDQSGRCLICNTWFAALHVDHCHSSGVVRALLCGNCNRGIGVFQEEPLNLRAAANYLEGFMS